MEQRQEIEERYTYAEYETWEDGKRWELIDGVPFLMSPAPTQRHQEIGDNLTMLFKTYLRGKKCKAFSAPFDVRLNPDRGDDTVVQPDFIIVCDPSKLANGKNCVGAPDLVVEILSPSTRKRDRITKFHAYREAGVREYWLIDPEDSELTVHLLKDGQYVAQYYAESDQVKVTVLDDCRIDLAEVFLAE